jgi:hypothetical protein
MDENGDVETISNKKTILIKCEHLNKKVVGT